MISKAHAAIINISDFNEPDCFVDACAASGGDDKIIGILAIIFVIVFLFSMTR